MSRNAQILPTASPAVRGECREDMFDNCSQHDSPLDRPPDRKNEMSRIMLELFCSTSEGATDVYEVELGRRGTQISWMIATLDP